MGKRLQALNEWVLQKARQLQLPVAEHTRLLPVSGDASFRRYFRLQGETLSWIAMDAPPDLEDSRPFLHIARHWHQAGVAVPQVLAEDLHQGFILLEDFGDQLLLPLLAQGMADALYAQAFGQLIRIQQLPRMDLPHYDQPLLQREMALFHEWFLPRLLGLEVTDAVKTLLADTEARLIESALNQTQVVVHRDYHSRNLMMTSDRRLGVIDFQDAVIGPVTYDPVSLLRDSYVDWSDIQVHTWLERYRQQALAAGIDVPEAEAFRRDFDLMGMQRQLKVCGIFARLWLRDGKQGYLNDIPRTLAYLHRSAGRYPEFADFAQWLRERVIPALERHPYYQTQSLSHWWHL